MSANTDSARSVIAAYLDNDGDIDVLSASNADDKITWYENLSCDGTTWLENIVSMDVGFAISVFAAEFPK